MGKDLAARYGWKIGDRVPLMSAHLAAEGAMGIQYRRHLRRRQERRQDAVLFPIRLPGRESGRATQGHRRLVCRQDCGPLDKPWSWARPSMRCSPIPERKRRRQPKRVSSRALPSRSATSAPSRSRLLPRSCSCSVWLPPAPWCSRFANAPANSRFSRRSDSPTAAILVLVLSESLFITVVGGGLGLAVAWAVVQRGDPTGGLLPIFALPPRTLHWASG